MLWLNCVEIVCYVGYILIEVVLGFGLGVVFGVVLVVVMGFLVWLIGVLWLILIFS